MYHLDVLATFHRDSLGVSFETYLRCRWDIERHCYDVAATFRCHVGNKSELVALKENNVSSKIHSND